ncbi:MAG: hypothetical protein ACE5H1_01370 [Thermodesulfobacteriota bacterium]
MRFVFFKTNILFIIFIAFSRLSYGQPTGGYTLTENQIRFAQSLKSEVPGVIFAKWQSPLDIWVEAGGVNQAKAKEIALEVVLEGKNLLNQSFCVHVHNGDWKQISMSCWSSP